MIFSDDVVLFSKACILGFMVAIPIGPAGLLILNRSLKVNALAGVVSGIGAALADAVFGYLAALGLAALIQQLEASRHFVRPLGSLILILVGLRFFFQKPPLLEAQEVLEVRYLHRYVWDMISAFFLTLLNPMTIIAFAAVFVESDLIPEDPRKLDYLEISAGVFAGSLLWWLLLVVLAQPVKRKLSIHMVHRVLQILGGILVGLGCLSLIPRLANVIARLGKLIDKML